MHKDVDAESGDVAQVEGEVTLPVFFEILPLRVTHHVIDKRVSFILGQGRTVFQQGAGQINALAAVLNPYSNCGNAGLNIVADLAGTQHFGGPARQDANGNYFIVDGSGQIVNQQGYLWNNGYLWSNSFTPSAASVAGVNHWVQQE